MATIPTYEPRLREQALEGGFQRAPDVSSDLMRAGSGMMSLGVAAGRYAEKEARVKADEADAAITTQWLQWDAENRNKYRGANADGYTQAAQEWWKKTAETYGKDLDPMARQMASGSLVRKQGAAMANVTQFVGAEKERHAVDTFGAKLATSIQFGVTTGDVVGTAAGIRRDVAAFGAERGWTTEMVQAEQLKHLSAMHLAQITKLASTDAAAAQTYYQANKGEVAASNQPRVEEILKGEADNQFATQFAAGVADKPLKDQLAEAAKITDPARREKALTQVKNNYALVKQAEAEQENQYADQAWQLFSQGKRIPEAILAGMAGRDRFQLQEAQRVRAERLVEKRTTVKTNPTKLAELYDMARDNPEEFKRQRLAALTEQIGASDMEQLARLQRDMIAPDKEQGAVTTVQAIGTYTRDMSKSDAALFQSAALTEIDRFQIKNKRPPTVEERRKLLDDLAVEGVIERDYWLDTKKRRFEMTPEEQAQAKFPTQPQQDKYTVGQVYRDAKGARAKYLGDGKWETVK